MAKKNFETQSKEKKILGLLISDLRNKRNMSLRKFAEAIEISPSNVTYIENGVNAPTAGVYRKIVSVLVPTSDTLNKMDQLYTEIRKTPPPDVCEILLHNKELGEKIRLLNDVQLSQTQIERIGELFSALKS